jgi:2-phosphosulfolactate phosphatase
VLLGREDPLNAFDVQLGWGPEGVRALGAEPGTVVLVDVLRFTTALDVAVAAGARVLPAPWPHDPAQPLPADVELADGRGRHGFSLSPASLVAAGPGDRIMLPSANGSHCAALAATLGVSVVGGCLRNADAVARWLTPSAEPARLRITVIACGERWGDGSLRPAVEDEVGAGAIIAALRAADPGRRISPEAEAAEAAFGAVRHDLGRALSESVSGRELRASDRGADIAWAADLNVSRSVPVLGDDGSFGSAHPTGDGAAS